MRAPMNIASLFAGMNAPDPNIVPVAQWEFNMGPGRPYRPRDELIDVLNRSIDAVFGPESVARVGSGSSIDYHGDGPDRPRHGSNRHETGFAADFTVQRPDGSIVQPGDPDADAFMLTAARNGILGIGHGSEYMGPAFHMDMVQPGPGQGHFWASNASRLGDQLVAAMRESGATGVPGGSRPGRVAAPAAYAGVVQPAPAAPSSGLGAPSLTFGDAPAAAAAAGGPVMLANAMTPRLPFGMNGLGTMLAQNQQEQRREQERDEQDRRLALIDLMRV